MGEIRLIGMRENETVEKQKQRGDGAGTPYDSDAFREANRLVLDLTYAFDAPGKGSIARKDVEDLIDPLLGAKGRLERGEGDIRDGDVVMTGWQDMPERIEPAHLREIRDAAGALSRDIDAFVSIGIGGSYLGIESTFRALTHTHFNQLSREERGGAPEIYFLGQNMDPDYFRDTLDMLRGKRVEIGRAHV